MKVKIRIAILFVTALAVILLASCKKSGGTAAAAGPEKQEHGQLEKTKPAAEKTLYQCPMHPTYVSD